MHIVSSRVTGTVVEAAVKSNQQVEENRLLARLDPEPFEVVPRNAEAARELARNEVAQARLSLAKASLGQAELDLTRMKNLVRDGVAANEVLDRSHTNRDVAAEGARRKRLDKPALNL